MSQEEFERLEKFLERVEQKASWARVTGALLTVGAFGGKFLALNDVFDDNATLFALCAGIGMTGVFLPMFLLQD